MLYTADIIVQKHQASMYVCQFTMKGLQGNSSHVLWFHEWNVYAHTQYTYMYTGLCWPLHIIYTSHIDCACLHGVLVHCLFQLHTQDAITFASSLPPVALRHRLATSGLKLSILHTRLPRSALEIGMRMHLYACDYDSLTFTACSQLLCTPYLSYKQFLVLLYLFADISLWSENGIGLWIETMFGFQCWVQHTTEVLRLLYSWDLYLLYYSI